MTGFGAGGLNAMSHDPEEAEARLTQWADGFAEKARRYQAVAEQTKELRLTATSAGGEVTVTVGADGSITALEFGSKARTIQLPELSSMILDTMRRAQAGIAGRVSDVMAEQLGDEDPQTQAMMVQNLSERFPDQDDDPDEQEWSPGQSRWPRYDDSDD